MKLMDEVCSEQVGPRGSGTIDNHCITTIFLLRSLAALCPSRGGEAQEVFLWAVISIEVHLTVDQIKRSSDDRSIFPFFIQVLDVMQLLRIVRMLAGEGQGEN